MTVTMAIAGIMVLAVTMTVAAMMTEDAIMIVDGMMTAAAMMTEDAIMNEEEKMIVAAMMIADVMMTVDGRATADGTMIADEKHLYPHQGTPIFPEMRHVAVTTTDLKQSAQKRAICGQHSIDYAAFSNSTGFSCNRS